MFHIVTASIQRCFSIRFHNLLECRKFITLITNTSSDSTSIMSTLRSRFFHRSEVTTEHAPVRLRKCRMLLALLIEPSVTVLTSMFVCRYHRLRGRAGVERPLLGAKVEDASHGLYLSLNICPIISISLFSSGIVPIISLVRVSLIFLSSSRP